MTRLICGVGENDYPHPISMYSSESGIIRRIWICPIYRTWNSMLRRCYSKKYQDNRPTYIGCTVTPEWHSFSVFRAWMLERDWAGKDLDKDILFPGNKEYSPATCVFISRQLNSFLCDAGAVRGDHPIGVYWHDRSNKFMAYCNNPFTGKRDHLGYFTSENLAYEAWRRRKHQHACRYAEIEDDHRICAALRIRYMPGKGVPANAA